MTDTPGPANMRPDKAVTASPAAVQGGAPDAPAVSHRGAFPAMIVGSIGVVYGDIGTSPLYALRESLSHAAKADILTEEAVIGAISLLLYALIFTVTAKYVVFLMRADNRGEGGILSLMALAQTALGSRVGRRANLVFLFGVAGAALFSGDAIITPAISVLSAVEGLDLVTSRLTEYVIPITIVILVTLFWVQSQGTARVAALFGPIMIVFFLTIGALGAMHIPEAPQVLRAFDLRAGLRFLIEHGWIGFAVLGSVFLGVTGAEALYADMGHFGAKPIRLAWYGLVFPTLVLSYAGQTALLIDSPAGKVANPFYDLCPPTLQLALVGLATAATVIASQSIITGAYSMTRQAIQLGLLPRIHISQTSAQSYGQIYVGLVNWSLMALTLVLTATFRSSDRLAAAFGVAVSLTMLLTSLLMFVAMREVWRWGLALSLLVAGLFICVDGSFVAANFVKFFDGGWIPILVAGILYFLMTCWSQGLAAMRDALERSTFPLAEFMEKFRGKERVAGTAVYLVGRTDLVPVALLQNLKHNKVIHKRVVLLNVTTENIPRVNPKNRLQDVDLADDFHAMSAHYGFMEQPNIPHVLTEEKGDGALKFDMMHTSFFVGRTNVAPAGKSRWHRFKIQVFKVMHRNAFPATEFFRIPPGRVVELGSQIEI